MTAPRETMVFKRQDGDILHISKLTGPRKEKAYLVLDSELSELNTYDLAIGALSVGAVILIALGIIHPASGLFHGLILLACAIFMIVLRARKIAAIKSQTKPGEGNGE